MIRVASLEWKRQCKSKLWIWCILPSIVLSLYIGSQDLTAYAFDIQKAINAWDMVTFMANNALVISAAVAIPFLLWVGDAISTDFGTGYGICVMSRLRGKNPALTYVAGKIVAVTALAGVTAFANVGTWLLMGALLFKFGGSWSQFMVSHSPYLPSGEVATRVSPWIATVSAAGLIMLILTVLALTGFAVSALVRSVYAGHAAGLLAVGMSLWLGTNNGTYAWSITAQAIWLLHSPFAAEAVEALPFTWSLSYLFGILVLAATVLSVGLQRRQDW